MNEPHTTEEVPVTIQPVMELDRAHVWMFHGDKVQEPPPTARPPGRVRHTVGILSTSFDAAYAVYRQRHPTMRITKVERNDTVVDYVVDRPEVIATIKRLGA